MALLLKLNDEHKYPTELQITSYFGKDNGKLYFSLIGMIEEEEEDEGVPQIQFELNKDNAEEVIKVLQEYFKLGE